MHGKRPQLEYHIYSNKRRSFYLTFCASVHRLLQKLNATLEIFPFNVTVYSDCTKIFTVTDRGVL